MNITCGDTGRRINDDFEVCLHEDLIWSISLAVLLFVCLMASGMTIYYKYEKQIIQWMFIHNLCLWLVTEEEFDRYKEFDAFIIYAQRDFSYIKEIQHFLEQENGFKLCLHERDWMPGDPISEQIDNSVENSRRTIILASRNFLNSIWCLKEFRAAYEKNQNEGPRRLIVILLEDDISVDDEIMNDKFRNYLKENTYLKWSDPRFRDKLKGAMPHPQNKGNMKEKLALFSLIFATMKRIIKKIPQSFLRCKHKILPLRPTPMDVEKEERVSCPLLTDSETSFGKFECIPGNGGTFSIKISETEKVLVNDIWYGNQLIYNRNGRDLMVPASAK